MNTYLSPDHDCPLCPRLVDFRASLREKYPEWHNGPVQAFIGAPVKLLIVGLAPGLHGANRTGRPFTGDWAGDLLYETMLDFGFATGRYLEDPNDGLKLVGCAISNAVHCVPPQNKPTPTEITTCRRFLDNRLAFFKDIKIILALGRIAHESTARSLGCKLSDVPFSHGAIHEIGQFKLIDSYHCSRYNTNTGRLTREMFRNIFLRAREIISETT